MRTSAFFLAIGVAITGPACAAEHWQQYARDCLHNPVVEGGAAPPLAQPRWIASADPDSPDFAIADFMFSVSSSPVVFDGKVYVYGSTPNWRQYYVAAFAAADGTFAWKTEVDPGVMSSWSSPAVDPVSRLVLVGSGQKVFALDADSGAERWGTDLESNIFNASFTAADGRAFVANATVVAPGYGEGGPGALFALNLGASEVHPLGEILWSQEIGVSSGCTPAYYPGTDGADSRVIVADTDGRVEAFDPVTGDSKWDYSAPDAGDWETTPGGAFWGGVSIEGGFAYASTYNFDTASGEDNSFTYKLDAATGQFVWRTPSERTDSVPVVYGDLVLVSGGLHRYGAAMKLEAFDKQTGGKLWEFTGAGGYTQTPAVINGICYIGALPEFDGYYHTLCAIDLSLSPADAGFVRSSYAGAGGTPAFAGGSIYSVGEDGLCAFGWPIYGDTNFDCVANILDLITVRNKLNADPASGGNWKADVNSDGTINILDLIYVRNRLNTRCPGQ